MLLVIGAGTILLFIGAGTNMIWLEILLLVVLLLLSYPITFMLVVAH